MGLIKALAGAVGGTLADQWVDYFKCDSLPANVLAKKGEKYISNRSSNTKASEDVITDGSRVDVADGQCMLIVENGKIVDFCAEPGQYKYNTGTQPSLLSGGLKGLGDSFKEIGKRFTAGGQQLTAQPVYYINTKELVGNKWGIGEVPFRDSEFNFTMKISAYGEYSYKITNPLVFYANICSNVAGDFTRDKIDSQLKAELQTAMQPALGRIALKKVAYDQLPLFTKDICGELNTELTADWVDKRGLSVVSFAVASVTPDAESAKKIEQFQETRVYTNSRMMGARIGTAQATAMENAASNEAGAMTGFLGMGFAQQAGGMKASEFYKMSDEEVAGNNPKDTWKCECGQANDGKFCSSCGKPKPVKNDSEWKCECGVVNTGKFCYECGKPAPEKSVGWKCECGAINKGGFCTECGKKKPEGEPLYKCDKCGWEPEDPKNPPKFCPSCGDKFTDEDIKK